LLALRRIRKKGPRRFWRSVLRSSKASKRSRRFLPIETYFTTEARSHGERQQQTRIAIVFGSDQND
jgi:hypothetical protein